MDKSRIKSYLNLLEIRHRAARRNSFIIGTIFVASLLAFYALGMTGMIEGLEIFVTSSVLIAFALGFVSSLARLETVRALREFVIQLLQSDESE